MERQIISISRELLNENDFENRFHPVSRPFKSNWYKKLYPPEPILAAIKPPMSQNGWKLFIFTHIPILNWIWNYQSNYFFGDIISGLTIGIMTIPQSIMYMHNNNTLSYRFSICSVSWCSTSIWFICIIYSSYCLLYFWIIKACING